ncbi:hypothetical protein [Sinomonas atrocyanea]|uniref:hypothetical protein n=1 Tax=Sinomonas atrocyanea TaxID=37927 RepID=UPI002866ADAA|nr:hypothetical protein [Sinomonas atrocyanea]MDR6623047.1 hypothetical protein [Sinomonas atrocyanea]
MSYRPFIGKVRRYVWRTHEGACTDGIGLMSGPRILAHLTPDEALALSNELTDLAETLEAERQETPK